MYTLSLSGSSYGHDLNMYFLQRFLMPGAEKQQKRMMMARTAIITISVAMPWFGLWMGVPLLEDGCAVWTCLVIDLIFLSSSMVKIFSLGCGNIGVLMLGR